MAFVLLLSNGLNYCNWNRTYSGWALNVISLILAVFLFTHKTRDARYHFRSEMLALLVLQFPSMINSWGHYGQSPIDSFKADLGAFTYAIYFVLHYYKVEERTILKAFLFIGLLIVGVQVYQQFSYPNCYFGINDEEKQFVTHELAEMRNGLWRFRMHCNGFFTTPVLFAGWLWLQKRFQLSLACLCALLLVSIYLTLTRQVMVACLFAIFFASFIGKRKSRKGLLILGIVLLIGLYQYYDVLFSSFVDQTQDESTEDNIRLLSAAYFWKESLNDVLTFLFGYGGIGQTGAYAQRHLLDTDLGFYTSDVGFIGQIYENGVLYVLTSYWLFYKIYFRFKQRIPTYIKMMVLFCVPMTPMIFPTISPLFFLVWIMLAYICDLHINRSPLALQSTVNA